MLLDFLDENWDLRGVVQDSRDLPFEGAEVVSYLEVVLFEWGHLIWITNTVIHEIDRA